MYSEHQINVWLAVDAVIIFWTYSWENLSYKELTQLYCSFLLWDLRYMLIQQYHISYTMLQDSPNHLHVRDKKETINITERMILIIT